MTDLYIVNEFDRPSERHIAEKRANGKFYYLHPSLRQIKQYHGMTPTNPTPLDAFGIRWMIDDGKLSGALLDQSTATYKDGRPRRWQGSNKFQFKI